MQLFWSAWIIGEFVRKRTGWIGERALREGCSRTELRRRLRDSRARVNRLTDELSAVAQLVNPQAAPKTDLSWLHDPDDHPVMRTALAARADALVVEAVSVSTVFDQKMRTALAARADALVTDNQSDFPIGEQRHGVLFLTSAAFLGRLYAAVPGSEAAVAEYLNAATG